MRGVWMQAGLGFGGRQAVPWQMKTRQTEIMQSSNKAGKPCHDKWNQGGQDQGRPGRQAVPSVPGSSGKGTSRAFLFTGLK
eukprot:1161899-Pelagomonas_calceolata.AAC.6